MQDIDQTIASWLRGWNHRDPAALAGLWDEWEPAPRYLAEEATSLLTTHEAIRDYWARTLAGAGFISVECRNLQVQSLAPELVAVDYEMRWLGSFAGHGRPIGGDVRVSAILRHRAAGWRFIHYVEAPLAPMAYLRRLYEQFAARPPAFPAEDD